MVLCASSSPGTSSQRRIAQLAEERAVVPNGRSGVGPRGVLLVERNAATTTAVRRTTASSFKVQSWTMTPLSVQIVQAGMQMTVDNSGIWTVQDSETECGRLI